MRPAEGKLVGGEQPDEGVAPVVERGTLKLRNARDHMDVGRVMGARVLLVVIVFGSDIAIARSLGPSARGRIAVLLVLPLLLEPLCTVGLGHVINHVGHARPSRLPVVARRSVEISLGLGLVLVLLLLTAGGRAGIFGSAGPLAIWESGGVALLILGEVLFVLAFAMALTKGLAVRANLARVWRRLILLVAAVLTFAVPNPTLDFACILAAAALGPILAARVLTRDAGVSIRVRGRLERREVVYAIKATPVKLAERFITRLDVVLLASILSTGEIGRYVVAVGIAEALFTITSSVGQVLQGVSAEAQLDRHVASARTGMLVALGVAILVGVAAPVAVPLAYGAGFANVPSLVLALLPGVLAYSGVHMLSPALNQAGRIGSVSAAMATGVVAGIVMLFVLVPRHGALGAAIAASVAYAVAGVLVFVAFVRLIGASRAGVG